MRLVPPSGRWPILDVCTGTGDLALAYDRAAGGTTPIVGADFCHEMLAIGRQKAAQAGADTGSTFIEADAQRCPLPSDAFQIVCVAFGLRNVADTDRGLAEMTRVCRTGRPRRRARILDARAGSRSRRSMAGTFAMCCRASADSSRAIRPTPTNICRPASASFRKAKRWPSACAPPDSADVRRYPLTFGVATLYVGKKADQLLA